MKLNENLSFNESLNILNEMFKYEVDHDSDGETALYIEVDREQCIGNLIKLLPYDYESYLREFSQDEFETFDITVLWSEVCCKFNKDIWANFKTNKFYVRRWHHVVIHEAQLLKRKVILKIQQFKSKYRNFKYIHKQRKTERENIGFFKKLGKLKV